MTSKQSLREEVWETLQESGDDLFPGAEGRIPNFKGRDEAAERLVEHDHYRDAETIKVNPDSPQTPVRKRALEDQKTLYMAVPKLKDRKCFLELDPNSLNESPSDLATIKGASEHGRNIHPDSMETIDLIVTGVVAADSDGRRLGKGGGYSDLEFAILESFDLISRDVPIFTTLHPVQELSPGRIPTEEQDITLSGMFRPDKSVEIKDTLPRPDGIKPDRLRSDQLAAIPILKELVDQH
jgi:5-formyltetrahydrofolate cyclo-ligase